jgi:hypothetical protein
VRLIRYEVDNRIEAFLAELVPPDDSAAERQRFVVVVWLAHTYVACGHTCPSAESRREFGIGADNYVSSEVRASRASVSVPYSRRGRLLRRRYTVR